MPYELPIVIEELNGKKRMIALRDRSLPYKGCSFVNGTQKMEITYFPGNPVAYVQVLGPEFGSTTLQGWWKDKFLVSPDSAPVANRFPKVTANGQPQPTKGNLVFGNTFASSGIDPGGTQLLRRSATVPDAFDLIKNSGANLKLEWQDIARYGHLFRTDFKEHGGDEIEFELEFKWTGATDAQPKVVKKSFKAKGLLDLLIGIVKAINNLLATVAYTFRLYIGRFAGKIAELLNALSGLIGTLNGFVGFKSFAGELISGIKSSLYNLRDKVRELFDLWDTDDNRLSQGRRNLADSQYGGLLMLQLRRIMSILAAEVAESLELLEIQTARETLMVYELKGLQSLRDISLQVYGTPNSWREIMYFNRLSSSFVSPPTELKIPRLSS